MEDLVVCVNAAAPMFIIMAVGYLAKRLGLLREEDVPRFNRVIFRIFIPLLVFYNLYNSDMDTAVRPRLALFAAVGVLVVFALTAFIVVKTVRDPRTRGVIVQGIYRSNYVVVGLPIASALLPKSELGVVTMLIALIVPIFNILAVISLEVFRGGRVSMRETISAIVTNPLIIGAAAGIAAMLCGLRLPVFIDSAVRDMAAVATPFQLFLLGGFFRFSGISSHSATLFWTVLARLVLVPAAVLPLGCRFGFRGAELVALIGCFGSSNAVSSFTMAQQMEGDAELAGDIVVLTSALCAFTLFGWTFLFKSLGFI